MELTKEQKRWIYIIGGIIAILFVVGLMLQFWKYTLTAIAFFVGGYVLGRRKRKEQEEKSSSGSSFLKDWL